MLLTFFQCSVLTDQHLIQVAFDVPGKSGDISPIAGCFASSQADASLWNPAFLRARSMPRGQRSDDPNRPGSKAG